MGFSLKSEITADFVFVERQFNEASFLLSVLASAALRRYFSEPLHFLV
jgi:hypothetical protein